MQMGIAMAVVATLAASGLLALVVVRAPRLGLMNHPRAALVAAVLGALLGTTVVLIQIGVPLTFGIPWQYVVTDYFLAMGHRLLDGPFVFSWGPTWRYPVGSLTPLIPVGAVLALAAAYSAHRYARRTAVVIVTVACSLLVAFVVAGGYAAAATWDGIAL